MPSLFSNLRRVGRANGANLDVGISHGSRSRVRLNIVRRTRISTASATSNTSVSGSGIGGVVAIQPEHVGVVVIPQAHNENHTLLQALAHARHTAVLGEDVLVAEGSLLGSAKVSGDGVSGDATDIGGGVGDDLAVLDVETLDLLEAAGVGAVVSDELGDDGHLGLGIDDLAGPVEALVAHAVGVEVTSVRVAGARVAAGRVGSTALVALAHGLAGRVTRVRSHGSGNAVGFPDIHLIAAGSVAANTGVLIVLGRLPALHVALVHTSAILSVRLISSVNHGYSPGR